MNSDSKSSRRRGSRALTRDGAWLDEDRWEQSLRILRDRQDGIRALSSLREVFARGVVERDAPHPITLEAMMVVSRLALLEMGLMLSLMPRSKRLRERLQNHDDYPGTRAELRAGLMLHSLGAEVEWEPVKGASGPDWRARWAGGALAVEVKCPRISERMKSLREVQYEFFSTFTDAASDPPFLVDSGVWLTLHLSDAIANARTATGSPDMDLVRALARKAADRVRRNLPMPTVAGRFSAGEGGDFSIQLGLSEEPSVQFGMEGLGGDDDHDAKRVVEKIHEAAEQLGALEDPGLVVLDAASDFGILRHLDAIYDTLSGEPWANKLAGVAVATQTGSSDVELDALRTDSILHVVPGVRRAALVTTILPNLRFCDRNHMHFDPLLAPSKSCPLFW